MAQPVITSIRYLRGTSELRLILQGTGFGTVSGEVKVNGRWGFVIDSWTDTEVRAHGHAYVFGGILRLTNSDNLIATNSLKIAVPYGYHDKDSQELTNDSMNDFWNILGSFWDNFGDRNIIDAVWSSMSQMYGRIQNDVVQTKDSLDLTSMPILWRETWASFEVTELPIPVSTDIISIPFLFKNIHKYNFSDENFQYIEGLDYTLTDGYIVFSAGITPTSELWAPVYYVDNNIVNQRLGIPLRVIGDSTKDFYNKAFGLWYAAWNGGSIGSLERGLNIMLSQPYSKDMSEVKTVEQTVTGWRVTMLNGMSYDSDIKPDLVPGQVIDRFEPVFKAASIDDHTSSVDWSSTDKNIRFFDSGTSFDSGLALDSSGNNIYRSSENIKELNTFRVVINYDALVSPVKDLQYINLLLSRYKPVNTRYKLNLVADFEDDYVDQDGTKLPADQFDPFTVVTDLTDPVLLDTNLDTDKNVYNFTKPY